jgi:hypothetical protein
LAEQFGHAKTFANPRPGDHAHPLAGSAAQGRDQVPVQLGEHVVAGRRTGHGRGSLAQAWLACLAGVWLVPSD